MQPGCSPLRISWRNAAGSAGAALVVGLSVGCGGGAAAPTPTPIPAVATVGAAPAASPQRPSLASPIASPSAAVPGAAATVAATPDAAGGTTYEVQSGDTLLSIAEKEYGDVTQWHRIYDANKDAIGADPDKLKLGMSLKIPPKQ